MATLRDIRKKIHAVDNIQKITQAMELVAASRLRKAETKAESARPYAAKLSQILNRLILTAKDLHHPLLYPRTVKKTGLVIIAGDRGLCGGYNQNVFAAAEEFLRRYKKDQVEIIPVGNKPIHHFEKREWNIPFKVEEWGGKITYAEIEELTRSLVNLYIEGKLDEIWLVYTHFISMSAREVRIEKLLKVEAEASQPILDDTIFEPDPIQILAEMLPLYCTVKVQEALNDAYASELAARVFSMRAATKNAKEMIEKLTLLRNKVRQSGITREIIEITSGAESLREG